MQPVMKLILHRKRYNVLQRKILLKVPWIVSGKDVSYDTSCDVSANPEILNRGNNILSDHTVSWNPLHSKSEHIESYERDYSNTSMCRSKSVTASLQNRPDWSKLGTPSVLKAKLHRRMKTNISSNQCNCVIRNNLPFVIHRESSNSSCSILSRRSVSQRSDAVIQCIGACMPSRHFSQGSGADVESPSCGVQQNDTDLWEMLVDYEKSSATERKIHDCHRLAVKVRLHNDL